MPDRKTCRIIVHGFLHTQSPASRASSQCQHSARECQHRVSVYQVFSHQISRRKNLVSRHSCNRAPLSDAILASPLSDVMLASSLPLQNTHPKHPPAKNRLKSNSKNNGLNGLFHVIQHVPPPPAADNVLHAGVSRHGGHRRGPLPGKPPNHKPPLPNHKP